MAKIGSFGDVTFEISENDNGIKALSFQDMVREGEAVHSEHPRDGKKPWLEFSNPGLDEVTFTIIADAKFQVKPKSVEKKLIKYKNAGTAKYLVLGGAKVGSNPFVITKMSDAYKTIIYDGRIQCIMIDITLKEKPKAKKKKKPTNQNKRTTSQKEKASNGAKKTTYDTYVVKKGDSLWAIAKKYYKNGSKYTKIYNANKDIIKNPNIIHAGWKLKIPK